jgi:hypothetical protein
MIVHQTEGVNTMAESLHPFLQEKEHLGTVGRGRENIPAAIAAKHDMIDGARKMNARFA